MLLIPILLCYMYYNDSGVVVALQLNILFPSDFRCHSVDSQIQWLKEVGHVTGNSN